MGRVYKHYIYTVYVNNNTLHLKSNNFKRFVLIETKTQLAILFF